MGVPWTRDEIILALDALFFSGVKNFKIDSPVIIELSDLLNHLPIIPLDRRDETFRNPLGVSMQLSFFSEFIEKGKTKGRIGKLFFSVYRDYENNVNYVHSIATNIRRNEKFVRSIGLNVGGKDSVFPEGVILNYVHRYLEQRWGRRVLKKNISKCSLCGINPEHIYGVFAERVSFFEPHLLVSPVLLSPEMKFTKDDFLLVCPNCHHMLHQIRPWRNRDACYELLSHV